MGLFSGKCISPARLDGKTAIITGANTGIGIETVKDFFKRGARVVLACRSIERAQNAIDDIKRECRDCENLGELQIAQLDLASLKSVRSCAEKLLQSEKSIELLVNNAGLMICPESKSEDGFELQFGTNHLGHFLFTLLLLPKICQSTSARIVNVSSLAHKKGVMDFDDLNWERKPYSPFGAYRQSKLANVLFSTELSRRLEVANIKNVTVYALHPGVISTELGRHLHHHFSTPLLWMARTILPHVMKTPLQGAQTTIYCAVDESCASETGLYYSDCAVQAASERANSVKDAEVLWERSLKLVGLPEDYNPFVKKE